MKFKIFKTVKMLIKISIFDILPKFFFSDTVSVIRGRQSISIIYSKPATVRSGVVGWGWLFQIWSCFCSIILISARGKELCKIYLVPALLMGDINDGYLSTFHPVLQYLTPQTWLNLIYYRNIENIEYLQLLSLHQL